MTLSLFTPNLIDQLREQGFVEGPPAHLSAEFLMADLASYSRLHCEACGHKRHNVNPYHRGREYRLACVCRKCGHACEM